MIPGENSRADDRHSGVIEPLRAQLSYADDSVGWSDTGFISEHRNDVSAAAARYVGERDTFARTITADNGYIG